MDDVGPVAGPFAELCRVMGAPVVRVRAAIPEELLFGDVGAGTAARSLSF